MNATVFAFTLFATLPDVPAHDADTLVVGEGGDRFGYQITSGDLDDDGNLDLVVSAPHPGGGNRVYVFFGPVDLANTPVLEAEFADIILEGLGNSETGWAISVGDLLGSGSDDLVVSAPNESSGAGRVYLFEGPLPGGSSIDTGDADHQIDGTQSGAYLGWSLTIGDYDGDGFNELGAGACGAGTGIQQGLGEAYLFDFDGSVLPSSTADASATFKGSGQTGCALASWRSSADSWRCR